MPNRRHLLLGLLAGGLAAPAVARSRPTITLVVPFAPGGLTDSLGRLAGQRIAAALGTVVVVENQAGAAGVIAGRRVARAAPDGSTLFVATASQICVAPFTSDAGYTPADFTPISALAMSPFVICVRSSLGPATLSDLVAHGRANQGRLSFGSGGVGTLTHLSMAAFLARAGIEAVHAPYRGISPAFTDMLAGTIDMVSSTPGEVTGHIANPAVRLLGVTSAEPVRQFPGVPTVASLFPGFAVYTWNAIVGPPRLPADLVAEISGAIRAAARDADYIATLARLGVEPVDHAPEDFAAIIRQDAETFERVVRQLNIRTG